MCVRINFTCYYRYHHHHHHDQRTAFILENECVGEIVAEVFIFLYLVWFVRGIGGKRWSTISMGRFNKNRFTHRLCWLSVFFFMSLPDSFGSFSMRLHSILLGFAVGRWMCLGFLFHSNYGFLMLK